MKKQYFHLCTDATKDFLLFRDHQDYQFGMNLIPVCMQGLDLAVYCFILMSNHLHILLSSTEESAALFFAQYKQRLSLYFARTDRGISLSGWRHAVFPVKDREAFRQVTAYILRNCLKAGIDSPFSYPWSTASLYFNPWLPLLRGVPISTLTLREQAHLLHSHRTLPRDYLVSDGLILPSSYVDYQQTERIFGTSVDFFRYVRDWKVEDNVEQNQDGLERPTYADSQLLKHLQADFADYHVQGFRDMDPVTLRRFIRLMRQKYGATKQQVRRLSGVDEIMLERYW